MMGGGKRARAIQVFKAEMLKHEDEDQLLLEAYTQDIGSHD